MIKLILKQNNITLSQFAADLNISRPTLDAYVKNYDNDMPIQNNLYQKVFDFLFELPLSQEEFSKRYEYVKNYYGRSIISIAPETKENTLNNNEKYQKTLDQIQEIIDLDRLHEQSDFTIYQIVLNILKNKDTEFYKEFFDFFQYYKGIVPIKAPTEREKKIYTVLYLLFNEIKSNNLTFDSSAYDGFVDYCKGQYFSKQTIVNEIKAEINKKVSKIIQEKLESTKEVDTIDIEEIIENIKKNL